VRLAPADEVVFARDLDGLRKRLGTGEWDAAWAAGSVLTTDEAVSIAADEAPPSSDAPALSHREREVSALIAEGLTNRQIARKLSISEKTVGSHIDHIMTKLDLRSRTRIAVWAVERGLGPRPSG
jgi:DNA-binding NarL/FixJ family response regulator